MKLIALFAVSRRGAVLPMDDPRQRQPDIAKARELLEWKPVTALNAGLVKTIKYFDGLLGQLGMKESMTARA